jgi:mono/diheme cytochrome c family protein
MKTTRIAMLLGSAAMIAAVAASGLAPHAKASATAASPARVGDFLLVDQNRVAHELYRLGDAPAIVLVTQQNGDAVIRGEAGQVNKLAADYGGKGVEFMMLNSSLKDGLEAIQAEAAKAGYKLPVLMDDKQIIGEALGVSRSGEAIVIDPKTWQVAYHGAVAGLPAALDALLAHQSVPAASGASTGAQIAFPARSQHAGLTYVKDVAPILEKNCVGCHSTGGIGPFAMSNYSVVKGFAPMIAEVIRTDRMPPYHADPRVGHFSDSKRLSPDEIKTLVHWVEAGGGRRLAAGQAGPDPQRSPIQGACGRRDRLAAAVRPEPRDPGPLDSRLQRQAGRPPGCAPCADRLDDRGPEERDRFGRQVARIGGPLRRGLRGGRVRQGRRHLPAGRRGRGLPDALHALRQGGHRQHPDRHLLHRQGAEVHHARDRDQRSDDRYPAG